jgi:hypothetical protein
VTSFLHLQEMCLSWMADWALSALTQCHALPEPAPGRLSRLLNRLMGRVGHSSPLTGHLPDQTALHDTPAKVRDLGLALVEVRCDERLDAR